MHVYMYTFIHVYMYTRIHLYIYTCIHVYIQYFLNLTFTVPPKLELWTGRQHSYPPVKFFWGTVPLGPMIYATD